MFFRINLLRCTPACPAVTTSFHKFEAITGERHKYIRGKGGLRKSLTDKVGLEPLKLAWVRTVDVPRQRIARVILTQILPLSTRASRYKAFERGVYEMLRAGRGARARQAPFAPASSMSARTW